MEPISYTALIRTHNSARTLPKTLASLHRQTAPPCAHVIVDCASTDGTLACVPNGALVHRYVGKTFNYSEALNQGLEHVATDYVLIISSHTSLNQAGALAYALTVLAGDDRLGAAYFAYENPPELEYQLIDAGNFTGFNGLWNTCALIRTALARKRRFRPEVFAAEDQEWAKWLFECEGRSVARISGAGLENDNPLRHSRRKKLDEYAAIALFTNRSLLTWRYLAGLAYQAFRPTRRLDLGERYFNLALFARLLACRFGKQGDASGKWQPSPDAFRRENS